MEGTERFPRVHTADTASVNWESRKGKKKQSKRKTNKNSDWHLYCGTGLAVAQGRRQHAGSAGRRL